MPSLLSLIAPYDRIWSLLLVSFLLGIGSLWIWKRVSNQEAIRRARKRVNASLMEMRLFGDEPVLLLQAQRDLLTGNARLLALTIGPAAVLIIPLLFLISFLDPFYGRAPLGLEEAFVVTVHMKEALDRLPATPTLSAPAGIAVETPPVRVVAANEYSWRVRPHKALNGILEISIAGETLAKTVSTGGKGGYASDKRWSSWFGWLSNPGEARIHSRTVDWIEVSYAPASIRWLGMELHWLVWLTLVSMLTALLFASRMGVSL